ncbi:MAG TPA: peptidylprolyl isomerase, partial [Pseudolabrys sp.]|nr:peptidylprolyl isomerase [Pseudolabrys sp.]
MTIPVPAGTPVRSRQSGFYAALLALLVMAAGPAGAQDKDPVVAKVNGIEIHQSDLAVAEDEAGQIPPMSPEAK